MNTHLVELDQKRNVEILAASKSDSNKPLLILAHGAGNDMHAPFMESIATEVEQQQVQVVRFNFPYKVSGRKMPDRSVVLEDSWRHVINWVAANMQFSKLFIGGKSMGARISTMIAADFPNVDGLVFLGYPLHPPGKYDQIRDEYMYGLDQQMLFIQGTRDGFARMDLLQNTVSSLGEKTTLHWIEGGDHSFKVLVRLGRSYPEVLSEVATIVADWISARSA